MPIYDLVWWFLLQIFRKHYNINLKSIVVNGQLLPIDPTTFAISKERENYGTLVDSGSSMGVLVGEAYDPFVSAVSLSITFFLLEICIRVTISILMAWANRIESWILGV